MNLYDCKILLVDDEKALRDMVSGFLRRAGFHKVTVAANCLEAEELFALKEPHLVLLDVMLPDGDGFSLLKKLRQMSEVPVIFLSARDEDASRLRGLGLGADDYITKPFSLAVLMSKIHSVFKRIDKTAKQKDNPVIKSGSLLYYPKEMQLFVNQKPIELTRNEYKLLQLFLNHPKQILSKAQILEQMFDIDQNYVDDNTVAVNIRRLREKIKDTNQKRIIKNIRGMGYVWDQETE